MPDWRELVRQRMQPSPVTQADDIIEELSTHLEETYNDLLDRGYALQAAFERTLQEVGDWDILSRRVSRTRLRRNPMNDRIKHLWFSMGFAWLAASSWVVLLQRTDRPHQGLILFYLPWLADLPLPWLAALPLVCAGVAYVAQPANPTNDRVKRLWLSVTVTWLGASLSFIVLQRIDHPELTLRWPVPVTFSLPWLATLILVGAAGACLTQRADAPPKIRLLVATSPALLLGIVMLLLLPWGLAVDGYPWGLTFFAMDAETWAVVPGLALLLGALPFLLQRSAGSFPLPNGDASASMCSTAWPG